MKDEIYFMQSFIVIPLDSRPCSYDFLQDLGAIGQLNLMLPPVELLGNLYEGAQRASLLLWLQQAMTEKPEATVIVHLDSLLYGGLVQSRELVVRDTKRDQIASVLEGARKVMVALTLPRTRPTQTSENEVLLADFLEELAQQRYWKYVQDERYSQEQEESLLAELPDGYLDNFEAVRKRNLQEIQWWCKKAQESCWQACIVGMDDSSAESWSALEAQQLTQEFGDAPNLWIFPGTDELTQLLLAKAALAEASQKLEVGIQAPQAFYECWTSPFDQLGANEILALQASVIGLELADKADSNLLFWLGDNHNKALPPPDVNTIIVDLVKPNGGDVQGLGHLFEENAWFHWGGWVAWNTFANSIGTALAWITMKALPNYDKDCDQQFFLKRLLDDGLYQSVIRKRWISEFGIGSLSEQQHQSVMTDFSCEANFLVDQLGYSSLEVEASLPWNRLFEVKVTVQEKEPGCRVLS